MTRERIQNWIKAITGCTTVEAYEEYLAERAKQQWAQMNVEISQDYAQMAALLSLIKEAAE